MPNDTPIQSEQSVNPANPCTPAPALQDALNAPAHLASRVSQLTAHIESLSADLKGIPEPKA